MYFLILGWTFKSGNQLIWSYFPSHLSEKQCVSVKYAESSSDSSDDEPLAVTKKKLTKAPKEQKNGKKTKPELKDKSLKGRHHFHETGINLNQFYYK